jgi:hypothetical protein
LAIEAQTFSDQTSSDFDFLDSNLSPNNSNLTVQNNLTF